MNLFPREDPYEFQEFMQDVDGFEQGADAYIYVIVLECREEFCKENSTWYYVGQTYKEGTNGQGLLKNRLNKHTSNFAQSMPVNIGDEVVLRKWNWPSKKRYRAIGIERVKSLYPDSQDIPVPDFYGGNPKHFRTDWKKQYVSEQERKMAYRIAVEKETMNVIGGK